MDATWASIRLHAKALLDLLRILKEIRNYVAKVMVTNCPYPLIIYIIYYKNKINE